MELALVLGTVTVEDQRLYIKIETSRGKNTTEIHSALSEVCGELTVDCCTVSRCANHLRVGCVSINNDTRPGRPKTSTDEQSVKLVIYIFLKKIAVRHVRKFLKPQGFHQHQYSEF